MATETWGAILVIAGLAIWAYLAACRKLDDDERRGR